MTDTTDTRRAALIWTGVAVLAAAIVAMWIYIFQTSHDSQQLKEYRVHCFANDLPLDAAWCDHAHQRVLRDRITEQ